MSFLSSVGSFLSGSSTWSTLARTAILAYSVYKTQDNTKENGSGTANIDAGVRLQIAPSADSHIPVLYGSAFFGGNIIDARMTNNNKTMWYAIVLSERTASTNYTFNEVYWNKQRIVFRADGVTADYAVDATGSIDRSISGLVQVHTRVGLATLPAEYSALIDTAVVPDLENLVYAIVRVDYNREQNVTGLAELLFNVASDLNNPADVLLDYFTNSRYGVGLSSTDLLTADFDALRTYSNESIAYDDEGTGAETLANRYQINGLIDTRNNVMQNVEAILSAAGSWLSFDSHSGKWGIVINRAETASAAFGDHNILGSISVSGTGLTELYNAVKVEFPHRELKDSADFYNIELATKNAYEEPNTLNIRYDIINEPVQAQLLGLLELKQSRLDRVIQFETDFGYYNLKAGEVITVSNSLFGFNNQLFRIISVAEKQGDSSELVMEITALEYDSTMYTFDDLYRFIRSDQTGIITIGSIGAPSTPTVNKIEVDARPRITVSTLSPTGVVEGIEVWLSTDVAQADDTLRSYTLIATQRPANGGVYTSGTPVTVEYSSINAANFYVKVRGFNATTVGPFSSPSGLVEFVPTQVTNAIDANTKMFDETGQLLAGIALLNLAEKLINFFGDGPDKTLFERVFDLFQEETGVDLLGQAAEGTLVVSSELITLGEGQYFATNTNSYDFVGEGVTLTADQDGNVTVEIPGGSLPDGVNNKDILAWDAELGEWRLISNCIDCDLPPPPVDPVNRACYLNPTTLWPAAIGTVSNTSIKTDTTVPVRGSYFIQFDFVPAIVNDVTQPDQPFYTPLEIGSGNVYLYGTDGILEQTLSASQLRVHNDVVELPFAPRQFGKDYYIVFDAGIVTYCSCSSIAFTDRFQWNFRTSAADRDVYSPAPGSLSAVNVSMDPSAPLRVVSASLNSNDVNPVMASLTLTFSEPVKIGSGENVVIINKDNSTTAQQLVPSQATYEGSTVSWATVSGLESNTNYSIEVQDGTFSTNRTDTVIQVCGKNYTKPAAPNTFNLPNTFGFRTSEPLRLVRAVFQQETAAGVSIYSNIRLEFNKSVQRGEALGKFFEIYSADGSLHQKIPVTDTVEDIYNLTVFNNSNIVYINPTLVFKPSTDYYLLIDAASVQSLSDELFAGVTSTSEVVWRTDGVITDDQDDVNELGETGQPPRSTIDRNTGKATAVAKFGNPVEPGTGRLNIFDQNGKFITSVAANDPAIKFSSTQ